VTDAPETVSLAAAYHRVAARLVGRERELMLVLAAVAAGRDLILEGPPGTSKSTLLRAITAEWGIPLVFVEGNADLTRATREHPDIRQGSSVRGAIDLTLVAGQLLALRGITRELTDGYPEVVYDAMVVALSGRIFLDETVDVTPEAVLRQIWEDQFILTPAAAAPG
jgi:hypothetical protein